MKKLISLDFCGKLFGIFLLGSVIAACGSSGGGGDGNGGNGGGTTATLTSIQDTIFTPKCATSGCHQLGALCFNQTGGLGGGIGLDLSDTDASFASLVGVMSFEDGVFMRAEAGDPDNSYLVKKIQGDPDIFGLQMPLGLPPLDQDEIDLIREWITDGAFDN